MKQLARRITETSPKSFGMFQKAMMTGRDDLIHLEVGRPAADTPEHIKDATIEAIRAGKVHYSDLPGELHVRQALAAKLKAKNDLDVGPDRIIVTNGLTHASYAAIMAFLDDGDEAILLEPYYPQHTGKIELAGAKVVMAQLDASAAPTLSLRVTRHLYSGTSLRPSSSLAGLRNTADRANLSPFFSRASPKP